VRMVECVTHWMDIVFALQDGWEHSVSSVSVFLHLYNCDFVLLTLTACNNGSL